ncbi:hypothetical protein GH714_038518 [Hevea brasiliensis]|uniref:Uncharacterized protein n=1 Tax=Hevea brasiliensis TaxID=3981 RepID=A0A6A6M6T0_HEVBR|nr:hypothetical protein GH714_038518 [Hevea brasiliensis]
MDGNDNFEYVGGKIFYWEDRDLNLKSYLDIEDELKKLGYEEDNDDNGVEEVRVGDKESNEDKDYVPINEDVESGDNETENKAFVDFHTIDIEWGLVRQVIKKKKNY